MQSFLSLRTAAPFAYGRNDCCLFVADAVVAMTGTDIAAEYRERYHTPRQAMALLTSVAGCPSVSAAMRRASDRFGLAPVAAPYAARGDVLLVRRTRSYSLGLLHLDGKQIVVPTRINGLLLIPLDCAAAAWRI